MTGQMGGDSISMIAAFPIVIFEALPEAKGHPTLPAGQSSVQRGPKQNDIVAAVLSDHIHERTQTTWKLVEKMVLRMAPTTEAKDKLHKLFFSKLREALSTGIKTNNSTILTLAMVAPKTVACREYGATYPLGKTGSVTLGEADIRHPSYFKSDKYSVGQHNGPEMDVLAEHLIGVMLVLATKIAGELHA